MGCDIHGPEIWARTEVIRPSGGTFSTTDLIATLEWHRDYTCFGAIAGVRDEDIEAVSEPRGFPVPGWWSFPYEAKRFHPDWGSTVQPHPDCEGYHQHYYSDDCHSASWLTTNELVEAHRRYVQKTGESSRDMAIAIMIMRTAEQQGWGDVRILFCFDN